MSDRYWSSEKQRVRSCRIGAANGSVAQVRNRQPNSEKTTLRQLCCARLANFFVMHSRGDLHLATGRAYLCTHRRERLPVSEPLQFATGRGFKHSASSYLIDRHSHSAGPVDPTVRRQQPTGACAHCGEGRPRLLAPPESRLSAVMSVRT
jgi:hypothetical protein